MHFITKNVSCDVRVNSNNLIILNASYLLLYASLVFMHYQYSHVFKIKISLSFGYINFSDYIKRKQILDLL